MVKPRDDRHKDLFRPALDQIIDLNHPLVRLAERIDWGVPGPALWVGVQRGAGPSAVADPAGGGAIHPQARAQSVGRGAVRALDRKPVLPVVLVGNSNLNVAMMQSAVGSLNPNERWCNPHRMGSTTIRPTA